MSNWKFFLLKNNTEADYNGDVTVTGWKLILGIIITLEMIVVSIHYCKHIVMQNKGYPPIKQTLQIIVEECFC